MKLNIIVLVVVGVAAYINHVSYAPHYGILAEHEEPTKSPELTKFIEECKEEGLIITETEGYVSCRSK